MVAAESVVAMGHRIHQALEPGELGVFGDDLEAPVVAQVLELAQLLGDHGLRPVDDLWQRPIEGALLHDVEPTSSPHLVAVEANNAHAGARDEARGVFREDEDAGVGEVPVHEEASASQHLLVGQVGTDVGLVVRHHLGVHVVYGRAIRDLVLEVPLVLLVFEC